MLKFIIGKMNFLFIVASETSLWICKKIPHGVYLPAAKLFRKLYQIKDHKAYALLKVVPLH